jgi:hypothetical protein
MNISESCESKLVGESNVIWLRDISDIPYVRVYVNECCYRRKGKLKYSDFEVIGYTELEKDAPNNGMRGCFTRRVFWLKPHDRFYEPKGVYKIGCPVEAIDPLTIAPKIFGQQTDRAWGKPLPKALHVKSLDKVI